jgi:hypothetical protein
VERANVRVGSESTGRADLGRVSMLSNLDLHASSHSPVSTEGDE